MAEKERNMPEEASAEEEKAKGMWQAEKEGWYDKIPLTLQQLDKIVIACWIAIFVLILVIALDALDIFNPFGY